MNQYILGCVKMLNNLKSLYPYFYTIFMSTFSFKIKLQLEFITQNNYILYNEMEIPNLCKYFGIF